MPDEDSRVENISKDSAFVSGCTSDETNDTNQPLVFQCAQCNSILGDSTAWTSSNDILRSITLSSVTNKIVDIDDKFLTSSCGVDIGSTYSILQCEGCKEDVGLKYRSTTRELDDLRGLFTLFADKLTSYQIGCAEQTGEGLAECLSYPNTKRMNSQMLKLQTVVLSLNTRLEAVEKYLLSEEEGNGTETSSGIASPDSISVEQRSVSDANNVDTDEAQNGDHRNKSQLSPNSTEGNRSESPGKGDKKSKLIFSNNTSQPHKIGKKSIVVEREVKTDKFSLKTVDSPRRLTPGKRMRDVHGDSKNEDQVTPSAKRHYRADKSHGNIYAYRSPETNKPHRKRKD